jgi:hypothetical protein
MITAAPSIVLATIEPAFTDARPRTAGTEARSLKVIML